MPMMPMGGGSAHAWFAAPAAFVGMWIVMMVPMMLPSLAPALWRYRPIGVTRPSAAMALASIGYFLVWLVLGAIAFPLSLVLTRPAPIMTGVVVAIAGAWQFTAWKARHLACCREAVARRTRFSAFAALQEGIRLGVKCARSCGNLMLIPLAFGTMNFATMALVAVAITVERLAPGGEHLARVTGVVSVVIGVLLTLSVAGH